MSRGPGSPPSSHSSAACGIMSGMATPCVKWAGGKRRLVPILESRLPREFGTYHEPFAGGAALFLAVQPPKAVLSDANERLIRAYTALRSRPEHVIDLLRGYPNEAAFFEKMRQRSVLIDGGSDVEVAACFIYLNRTCYGGVYRVNQQNRFNVPFGRYKNPKICDEALLRSCSKALQGVTLKHATFEEALLAAKRGDFVYADPPYLPTSKTSSFTGYTAKGFDLGDHRRLRDLALELAQRGVHVLISNSAAPEILELYKGPAFHIERITAARSIGASTSSRCKAEELLISVGPALRVKASKGAPPRRGAAERRSRVSAPARNGTTVSELA